MELNSLWTPAEYFTGPAVQLHDEALESSNQVSDCIEKTKLETTMKFSA